MSIAFDCIPHHLHALLFISNAFISNVWLKLAKNQANAKQHPSGSSSTLSPQNNKHFLKTKQKQVCFTA